MRVPEQEREKERESLTEMINEWKREVKGKWSSVQEEWIVEKDRLCRARDEWELKTKTVHHNKSSRGRTKSPQLGCPAACQYQLLGRRTSQVTRAEE